MNAAKHFLLILIAIMALSGCAYRYYLGMHGPSIRAYPDIHSGHTEDFQCLSCHGPDSNSSAPPTTHPSFKGCLKCHNNR